VRAVNNDGWTALHDASQNGHKLVVDLLLRHRADVQAATTTNWTALHAASRNGHEIVSRFTGRAHEHEGN
jgi:ankyrin repeat protein